MGKCTPSPLTSLFIPSSLSRKLSGAFAQNRTNPVSADFLSLPDFTTLYMLYSLQACNLVIYILVILPVYEITKIVGRVDIFS